MVAMKTVTFLASLALVPALAGCMSESQVFDPIHCDYEQAQTTAPAVAPADRSEWADYNGDGVVVLCMWTGVVD
jgi:hypothetical protein